MPQIYTIGHSNHPATALVRLLRLHGIEVLVDVRSSPYSRHVPHANREPLALALHQAEIGYRWLGDRLGGKAEGAVADYDELRQSPAFQQGIVDLLAIAQSQCTAIMCAEGDHRHCHRYRLITPALIDRGATVLHIQPDGTLADEGQQPRQLSLF